CVDQGEQGFRLTDSAQRPSRLRPRWALHDAPALGLLRTEPARHGAAARVRDRQEDLGRPLSRWWATVLQPELFETSPTQRWRGADDDVVGQGKERRPEERQYERRDREQYEPPPAPAPAGAHCGKQEITAGSQREPGGHQDRGTDPARERGRQQ